MVVSPDEAKSHSEAFGLLRIHFVNALTDLFVIENLRIARLLEECFIQVFKFFELDCALAQIEKRIVFRKRFPLREGIKRLERDGGDLERLLVF